MPLSRHGIQVLDRHLGFAFNTCDSFEGPHTRRFDPGSGCHEGAKAPPESVQLELDNSRKRSNLVISDYD